MTLPNPIINNNNNNKSPVLPPQNKRKPKDYFFINKIRCPVKNCNRRISHLLYFLVGDHLDIKSVYGLLCEEHAQKKMTYYIDVHHRECIIEPIDAINKRTIQSLRQQRKDRMELEKGK